MNEVEKESEIIVSQRKDVKKTMKITQLKLKM